MNIRAFPALALSLLALLPLPSLQDDNNAWVVLYDSRDQYAVAGPPGRFKRGRGNGSSGPPGHNKWGGGRGPPGGHGPPAGNHYPPGLNPNRLPPGWNKKIERRPPEDGKFPGESNEEFGYNPHGPYNRRPEGPPPDPYGPHGPDDRRPEGPSYRPFPDNQGPPDPHGPHGPDDRRPERPSYRPFPGNQGPHGPDDRKPEESSYKPFPDDQGPFSPQSTHGSDDRKSDTKEQPQNDGQCRENEFRCKSNECLPQRVRCDNVFDCSDSSDEEFCVTNRNSEKEVGCVLPEQPYGGHYELGGCAEMHCNKRPGDTVPQNSILTYSCKDNYVLSGNTISICLNNDWFKPPSCVKVCPALKSTSVDISCSYQGQTVSCSERIVPGTRATLSCKSSYKLPLTNDPAYREITCLEDGLWDRRIFRCLPECGTSIAHGTPLIVNGFEARAGIFPWHVGIYRKKKMSEYEQICGGTLISSNLVVSAAHCFYDEVFNELHNVSNYAVAAGKHYRDWDADEQYCQKSFLESIQSGGRYMGARGNFADDIALVKLQKPFELTVLVRPICMDWDNVYEREHLHTGQSGKVVGWGKNIKGEPSESLQEIDMPYVPYEQCLSAVPMDFRGFLTSDKFCAGRLNGSSVCDGDSGGGLCFERDGIWYLRGIVSVSPAKKGTCDYNSYVGFTYISRFRDWIREGYVKS